MCICKKINTYMTREKKNECYPTDIFWGIIVGVAAGYIGYQIIRKLQKLNKIV